MSEHTQLIGSITIRYDEPDVTTYKAVDCYAKRAMNGAVVHARQFATGDANFDYHCGLLWLEGLGCEIVMGASSCDHFEMDGGTIDLNEPNLKERLRAYQEGEKAKDAICAICDGGPGNDGVCLCGHKAYDDAKPADALPEETFANGEGPECPFCHEVMTADESEYFDENGFETECGHCDNVIHIQPLISVSWTTKAMRRKS